MSNYGHHNKDINVPPNFDWIAYRSLNKDLRFITNEKDAIKHWKMHGNRQDRIYSFSEQDHISVTGTSDNVSSSSSVPGNVPGLGSGLGSGLVVIDNKGIMNNKIVNTYQNKVNNVPENFNWLAYKSLNKDLNYLKSYTDAVKHYQMHGCRQNRPYQFENSELEQVTPITYMEKDLRADQLIGISETNYEELNKSYGVPIDFDWRVYKSNNLDLNIKTYHEAIQHFIDHGHREKRKYSKDIITKTDNQPGCVDVHVPSVIEEPMFDIAGQLPHGFNWIAYKTINPDLHHLTSFLDAAKHYILHGKRDGRPYQMDTLTPVDFTRMEKVSSDYDWISYRPINPVREKPIEDADSMVDLPKEFDWRAYKLRNTDLLSINSQHDAIKHYKEHGYKEHRPYIMEFAPTINSVQSTPTDDIPSDFNWIFYRSKYSDLSYLISNEQEAIQHYREHGRRENRQYKSDPNDKKPVAEHKPKIRVKPKIKPSVLPIVSNDPPKCPSRTHTHTRTHARTRTHDLPQVVLTEHKPPKIIPPRMLTKLESGGDVRIVSTPAPGPGMIPNIIHFVYGFKEQSTEFDLYKYVAIMSAYHVNRPDVIYFHYRYEPFGPLWNMVKPYLTMDRIEPPEMIFDKKIKHYAHKADVVRLNILNEKGGIYLDIDTICVRPLAPLMKYDFVMGIQGDDYGLCNAIMMSKNNTDFGQHWYKSYESFNQQWDLHSVKIPYTLSKINPITILPNDAFFYPLWDPFAEKMLSDQINHDCCRKVFKNAYCMHLWETWCGRDLQKITPDNVHTVHSMYNLMARKYFANSITIIMVVPACATSLTSVVASIGSFYQVLMRDDVVSMVIYNNSALDLHEYLDNLPNINPKFVVMQATQPENVAHVKRQLCEKVVSGIIFYMDQCVQIVCEHVMDTMDNMVELLYDESVGMVGFSGGNIKGNICQPIHTDVSGQCVVSYVQGCQVFRSELVHYGIKLDPDNLVPDLDYCCQIRNVGKKIVMLTDNRVNVDVSGYRVTKEMMTILCQKWSHLDVL
jgi:hypothetical protein